MSTKPFGSTSSDGASRRTFSTVLKKKIVNDLDKKLTTVALVCRRYEVSRTSVYKWIAKFSTRRPGTKIVIEMESEAHKTVLLQNRVDELYRLIGQQQVTLDLHAKIFQHVSEEVGYDVKKKYAPLFSKTCVEVPKTVTQ